MNPIVAAVQMSSGDVVQLNLDSAAMLLGQAAERGAAVAVLPENFSLMPADGAQRRRAAGAAGVSLVRAWLRDAARANGLWIIGGTVPISSEDGERVRAACLVYDAEGKEVARYDKIHLFDVALAEGENYLESAYIEPGGDVVGVETPVGTVGLTVCYDVRFAEHYRRLSAAGARVFSVPSAFSVVTGRAHWELLLRARAVEGLAWVVAPAQHGSHFGGRKTYGHSMIVNPWGQVVSQLEQGNGVVTAEIDFTYQDELRRRLPCLEHRKL